MNIIDATTDPALFARWFRDRDTWAAWFAWLAALFALPMTSDQLAVYRQCTGRTAGPTQPAAEGWLICGRRAGKSFILALVAVFLACFRDYAQYLAPGERATVLVIATDRRQARVILRFVRALLTHVPMLAEMIERETAEAFDLSNGVSIEVGTASYRSTRGYSFAAVLADELAFWPGDDSAEPDYEILDACRPGLVTIPGALLLCASSPYSRRGSLWDAHRKHFGQDGDPVLVWHAPSRVMNPTIPQEVIDRAMERDPASASAEWLAEFRTDIERLFTREAIDAVVSPGVRERSPVSGIRYSAFVDPSGGSADAFTLAIGHRQDDTATLDALRERRPPFSPEAVVDDFAAVLKAYGVTTVRGDRYAGEWPREQFRKRGIAYELADKTRSDLYRDLVPAVNSGKVDLLDSDRLTNQLIGLERHTARSGKDAIDHAPGSHDDLANACAGVIAMIAPGNFGYDVTMSWVGGPSRG